MTLTDAEGRTGLHESIRVPGDPRVIDRQMVGNEIKDEPEADLPEPRPKHGERLGPAECGVDRVPVNGVRRAYDIRSGEIGQGSLVLGEKIRYR
jgi:hypothetical protein